MQDSKPDKSGGMSYGYFDQERREYVITRPDTNHDNDNNNYDDITDNDDSATI